jgi:hypothetical protein
MTLRQVLDVLRPADMAFWGMCPSTGSGRMAIGPGCPTGSVLKARGSERGATGSERRPTGSARRQEDAPTESQEPIVR